jgi:hypothetical protein
VHPEQSGAAEVAPGTGQAGPGTGQAGPGAAEVAPGTGQAGPGTGQVAPGTGQAGPGTGQAGPGTGQVAPGTGQAGPSATEAAPGTGQAGPDAAAQPGPGAAQAEPGTAQAGPGTAPGPQAGPGTGPAAHGHWERLDSGGLLYGTIVSAAALAVGATRGDTAGGMFETMVATLLIYWFAHIYTATVSARRPGNTVPLYRLVAASARHEAPILIGGLPAVAVVAILSLMDTSLWVTVLSDAGVVIVVLALDGLLAGLHAGTRGWRLGIEAGSAAVMGGLLAALLVSLHRH